MSGFPRRRGVRVKCLAALVLFVSLGLWTQAFSQLPHGEETPAPDLLEFLGSFEDRDAGWIDPFELEEMGGDNATREEFGHEK